MTGRWSKLILCRFPVRGRGSFSFVFTVTVSLGHHHPVIPDSPPFPVISYSKQMVISIILNLLLGVEYPKQASLRPISSCTVYTVLAPVASRSVRHSI